MQLQQLDISETLSSSSYIFHVANSSSSFSRTFDDSANLSLDPPGWEGEENNGGFGGFTEWASSVYWRERERGSGFLDTSSKVALEWNFEERFFFPRTALFFVRSSKSLLPLIVVNRELVRRELLRCALLSNSMMNTRLFGQFKKRFLTSNLSSLYNWMVHYASKSLIGYNEARVDQLFIRSTLFFLFSLRSNWSVFSLWIVIFWKLWNHFVKFKREIICVLLSDYDLLKFRSKREHTNCTNFVMNGRRQQNASETVWNNRARSYKSS